MPIKTRETTSKSDAPVIQSARVRKIVFDKGQYADETSVKKYLDGNGYTDYTLASDDNTFTAESTGITDDIFVKDSIRTVKMADGITGYVGKMTEQALKKATSDAAEKTDEPVVKTNDNQIEAVKLDSWTMYYSDDVTVAGVIKDGMDDGVPPGTMEIVQASIIAVGNALKQGGADRSSTVASIGSELAMMINKTADLYDGMLTTAKKSAGRDVFVTQYKADTETMLTFKAKADTEDAADGGADEDNEDANGKTKTKKEDAAPGVETSVQTPAPIDMKALGDMISSTVSKVVDKAVAPLNASIDEIRKTVDTVREVASKAATEVAEIAAQAPTKKSVSEQHISKDDKAEEQQSAKKAQGMTNFRSAIGLNM